MASASWPGRNRASYRILRSTFGWVYGLAAVYCLQHGYYYWAAFNILGALENIAEEAHLRADAVIKGEM